MPSSTERQRFTPGASTDMSKRSLLFMASLLFAASLASTRTITYDVIINTTSITGTTGSLDVNFNPGPLVTQAADLQILNFTSDGSLANCAANVQESCSTGDVSGTRPGNLAFDKGIGFNDYFVGFTFGTTISFEVSLYGPALSAPDMVSTSGSTFAFSMFSDAAGTIPVLTSDTTDGFAFTVGLNLDGTNRACARPPGQLSVLRHSLRGPADTAMRW
jgi:hypothetical protein